MTEKEWHTLYDGSGSDLDIALHNRETNEYVWIVENAIYQLKGIEKVCDKLNELNDEYWVLQGKYYKLKHYHSNLHDELCDVEVERDSLKKDVEDLEKENKLLKKSVKRQQKSNEECSKYIEEVAQENKKLKQKNKELLQLKHLLQDIGIIQEENEILEIRKEIASKFLKPLFNGKYDVDINIEEGFTILPKENKE